MAIVVTEKFVPATGDFVFNRQYIFMISTIAALGGLLFGYDLANISGTIHFFKLHYQLSDMGVGWAVGCISVGAATGALMSGKLSDILGRKKILIIAAVVFAITGVGTGWAGSYTLFIIFRLLSGLAIGCATVVCPIYIAEISPAHFRGRLVAYYQLAITLGVLLAYFSNYLLLGAGPDNWRWMFSSQSVPALFFLTGLLFVIESPRWLMGKKREREAVEILTRIGGTDFAEAETGAIKASFSTTEKQDVKVLFSRRYLPLLFAGVCLAVFSQMGGSFTAYGPEIFKETGIAQDSAFLQSVLIGVILFLFTLVAIATVEKAGRRKLLLYGVAMLFLITLGLTLAFYFTLPGIWVLVLGLAFTAVYAATVGPVTWVVLAEMFPNRIRGSAMSLATLALWIANFVNTASFPVIRAYFGMAMAFGVYVPLFIIYFLFIYSKISETKGKTLEEIELMTAPKPENYAMDEVGRTA